jgi:hypothetical protein
MPLIAPESPESTQRLADIKTLEHFNCTSVYGNRPAAVYIRSGDEIISTVCLCLIGSAACKGIHSSTYARTFVFATIAGTVIMKQL